MNNEFAKSIANQFIGVTYTSLTTIEKNILRRTLIELRADMVLTNYKEITKSW